MLRGFSLFTAIATACFGVAVVGGRADTESPPALEARWRHPVALEFVDDHLLVANARSGTISVVHLDSGRIVREVEVGKRLSDLAVLPAGRGVLVADDAVADVFGGRFAMIDAALGRVRNETRFGRRNMVELLPTSERRQLRSPGTSDSSATVVWHSTVG